MIQPIGLLTLALCFGLIFIPARYAVICFVVSLLLGAAAAFVLGGSGNIQPSHVLLAPMMFQIVRERHFAYNVTQVSQFPRPAFWLITFVSYSIVCSFLSPRLFAGVTEIMSIGSTKFGPPSTVPVPLTPTSGNINQSVYIISDLICFLLVYSFCCDKKNLVYIARCIVLFAVLNIIFAAADYVTSVTNTAFLLDPVRNAEYDLHLEENVGGLRRIVGSFTETSLFSFHTIGAFAYTFSLWLSGRWKHITLSCAFLSLMLLLLSTSGTAYASVVPVLMVFYAYCAYKAVRGECTTSAATFLLVAPLLAVVLFLFVFMNDSVRNTLSDFISATVLSKSLSESGIERAKWNALGIKNFYDTYALGSGLGTTRTSSWLIALLASTGVPGTILMCSFLWSIVVDRPRTDALVNDVRKAARFSCFAYLVAGVLSFSLVDLRLPFFVLAAVSCARPYEREVRRGLP